ncbi:MAG: ribonuclease R [Alphaproteobacteria bacterium]|nr:ribonuclease R [Alphaproteobacteria bacterium]
MPKKKNMRDSLPNVEQLKNYINNASREITRRDIARAFNIRGNDKVWLKKTLRELIDSGDITLNHRRKFNETNNVPSVSVVEITKIFDDGGATAQLVRPNNETTKNKIVISYTNKSPSYRLGDHVLVKLRKTHEGYYKATVMRRLEKQQSKVIGIVKEIKGSYRLIPIDGKKTHEASIETNPNMPVKDGDIIQAEFIAKRNFSSRKVKTLEIIGNQNDSHSISLISIHEYEIPTEFSVNALTQASAAQPVFFDKNRKDMRDINLITIDGADARDFDDAVWAEVNNTTSNPNGWRLIVAIADVANYVRPDDALDIEAKMRGNSVYFPDRVVPMLPEALSNGLCSLRPNEDRACLAVEIIIDSEGRKQSHKFIRGLMQSKARVTYEELQSEFDMKDQKKNQESLIAKLATPLYGAFFALLKARTNRGALDIEVPEMKVQISVSGQIEAITNRERLDSHRLIEEFMVLANVCAAETLENKKYTCVYRIHDVPSSEKVDGLRLNLNGFGIKLSKGQVITAKLFNEVLKNAEGHDAKEAINQLVLRSQSQAVYSPNNLGHFGLGLRRYAHFTSPIRRYSDLLVHRALISSHNFGTDGDLRPTPEELEPICEEISKTERRAALAERSANDRYSAVFMTKRIGENFDALITGVNNFGVFVRLDGSYVDALLPISSLPYDYYDYDEKRHLLTGRKNQMKIGLGDRIPVTLRTADPITGRLAVAYAVGLSDAFSTKSKKTLIRKNKRRKLK